MVSGNKIETKEGPLELKRKREARKTHLEEGGRERHGVLHRKSHILASFKQSHGGSSLQPNSRDLPVGNIVCNT